jgi:hypothetical protein
MNVLVMTYWSFREPLIQAATLPYVHAIQSKLPKGSKVFLLTLEKDQLKLSPQEKEQVEKRLAVDNIHLLTFGYYRFGISAFIAWGFNLLRINNFCRIHHIEVLHAFASPIGTVAHIIARWRGIKYVIDSFEPHAESMVENGSWRPDSLAFKLLFKYEALQAKNAFAVLGTTAAMRDYSAEKYGCIPARFLTKPACVDLNQFDPDLFKPSGNQHSITCVYAGKIGGIYLEQEIFDFFKVCSLKWKERFRVILLTDTPSLKIDALCAASGLSRSLVESLQVEHQRVPEYLSQADFAFNPVKPVPSKRYCTSIKDGEYWAMGLPIVIPAGISDDSGLIKELGIGAVLGGLHSEAYWQACDEIERVLADKNHRDRIRQVAYQHRNLDQVQALYDSLYGEGGLLSLPVANYLALIYNSYRDPLFQNLMLEYLKEQFVRHPNYTFHLITFEQKKYALSAPEIRKENAILSGLGIQWTPLTYHSGRLMLSKKLFDFTAALYKSAQITFRHRPKMIIAFANTSAAISVVLSKLLGLDMMVYSYEPHSEFLAEFGVWKKSGFKYKLLSRLENAAARRSKYILTGTKYMVEALSGKTKARVLRAPSAVDHNVFKFRPDGRESLRKKFRLNGKKVMVYVGKFGGIYYENEIADFFAAVHDSDPNWFLVVLTPEAPGKVESCLARLTKGSFLFTEAHTPNEVSEWLSAADIGLNAIPPHPSQKFRSPVKVGEYLLCGLPYITCVSVSEDDLWANECKVGVVVPNLSYESGEDCTDEILSLLSESPTELRSRCRETGRKYRSIERVHQAFDEALDYFPNLI